MQLWGNLISWWVDIEDKCDVCVELGLGIWRRFKHGLLWGIGQNNNEGKRNLRNPLIWIHSLGLLEPTHQTSSFIVAFSYTSGLHYSFCLFYGEKIGSSIEFLLTSWVSFKGMVFVNGSAYRQELSHWAFGDQKSCAHMAALAFTWLWLPIRPVIMGFSSVCWVVMPG